MAREPALIMHVLHHLVVGGMENGVVNLINHLPRERFRHAVLCIEDYSDFRQRIVHSDVEVHALRRSKIGTWALRRELYRRFRAECPAIVHTRNLSGLDALLPARLAGVPCTVHSEHGWDVDNLDGRHWKPALLRRLHAPLVNHFVAVAKDIEQHLQQRIGVNPKRLTQIYNGVDTDRFVPRRPSDNRPPLDGLPESFRQPEAIVIGTVGRVQTVKDQATLLHAFHALRQRLPEHAHRLRLAIVGDGPLLGELRQLSTQLGINDACWLPGSLNQVPAALACMDVFVLPSLMEGTSNTILEAMATGLPVLATAVGGNVELVSDHENGRLFAPRDAATLTKLLADYVQDGDLLVAHGAASRRIAQATFSLTAMTTQYAAMYDAVRRAKGV